MILHTLPKHYQRESLKDYIYILSDSKHKIKTKASKGIFKTQNLALNPSS